MANGYCQSIYGQEEVDRWAAMQVPYGTVEQSTQITEIDESTRKVAESDSGDGRWAKGDEVALVQDNFHPGSWGWACVKSNQSK